MDAERTKEGEVGSMLPSALGSSRMFQSGAVWLERASQLLFGD